MRVTGGERVKGLVRLKCPVTARLVVLQEERRSRGGGGGGGGGGREGGGSQSRGAQQRRLPGPKFKFESKCEGRRSSGREWAPC